MGRTFSKSQAAFIMSARKLFQESDKVYFWTFTFNRVMPDWYYPRSWQMFIVNLQNAYGGFLQGLRVLEVHPGGHGLHYHALLNRRVSVHLVRRHAKKVGIGIVQVEVATRESAEYLAKYLTKTNPLWPGMRRWGPIGGFKQVPKNRLEVDSVFHRNFREMNPLGKQIPIEQVQWCWRMSALYGEIAKWPTPEVGKIVFDNQGKPDSIEIEMQEPSKSGESVTQRYRIKNCQRVYALDPEKTFVP